MIFFPTSGLGLGKDSLGAQLHEFSMFFPFFRLLAVGFIASSGLKSNRCGGTSFSLSCLHVHYRVSPKGFQAYSSLRWAQWDCGCRVRGSSSKQVLVVRLMI